MAMEPASQCCKSTENTFCGSPRIVSGCRKTSVETFRLPPLRISLTSSMETLNITHRGVMATPRKQMCLAER
eukprot:CAMPEP_0172937920 /NCGR_PEP_ID=MMETSP1075-20121228/222762_1 /TAXON_ID=2916 /ORGANISM="Ceratium fusus, Strain PA161109" /LENGTH=71 /DNA_ID=CAMNT_0013799295 /DNA_START=1188 /DNA_END=1403 /DNA_ORIENTATION=+